MSDYDLPGMGDFLPPERTAQEPCADCLEERDLPRGIEISVFGRLICYLCLQDHLDDQLTPSGSDHHTEQIINELVDDAPADQDATIHHLPPRG